MKLKFQRDYEGKLLEKEQIAELISDPHIYRSTDGIFQYERNYQNSITFFQNIVRVSDDEFFV